MQQERDEELELYFDRMKALCDFPPFQTWVADLAGQAENINSVVQVKNNEDLFHRKGQMDIINTAMNLRENIDILEEDYLKSLEPDGGEEDSDRMYES